MNELDVLKDISNKLEEAKFDFMLSGSLAMSYYAQPRMTRDIDLVVQLSRASSSLLYDILREDYYISKEAIDEALGNESMFNAIHREAIVKVDFIVRKGEEYRIVEFGRRKKIHLGDMTTYIVSVEDLIISKILWMKGSGSELQRKDIVNLLKVKTDEDYMETWLRKLGLHEIYDRIKNE
jgi:hypothetical protein